MTLQQHLEQDREQLIRQLDNAETPERSKGILEAEIDRLLYAYNEEADNPQQRDAAAAMMKTTRMAMPLLDSIGSTEVWEKNTQAVSGNISVRRSRTFLTGIVLLLAGAAAMLTAGSSFFMQLQPVKVILYIIACGGLGGGGFLIGRQTKYSRSSSKDMMVTTRIDSEKIYRTLLSMVLTADQNLQSLEDSALQQQRLEDRNSRLRTETEQELGIYADLLEGLYSGDGEFALDRLEKIRYYLHKQGIEVVDFTSDTAEWFDRMPSSGGQTKTLRPAMCRNGILLYKGLAAGGQNI